MLCGMDPDTPDDGADAILTSVLERSREHGLLGPGPVEAHLAHSQAWASLVPEGAHVLDLGSGGGIPGLPLAVERTDCSLVLLDAMAKRGAFLAQAVEALELADRVEVRVDRAETAGHDHDLRAAFDVVVARSFGAPAVTAECAAPFLRQGGWLLVSEPPGAPEDRWDDEGLEQLGLERVDVISDEFATIRRLRQAAPCPERYPRGVGRPSKRPLF